MTSVLRTCATIAAATALLAPLAGAPALAQDRFAGDSPLGFSLQAERTNPEDLASELLQAAGVPAPVFTGAPVRTQAADDIAYLNWEPVDASESWIVTGWQTLTQEPVPTRTVTDPRAVIGGLTNDVDYTFLVTTRDGQAYDFATAMPTAVLPMPLSPPRLLASDDDSVTVSLRPLRPSSDTGPIVGYQVRAVNTQTGQEFLASTDNVSRPTVRVTGLEPSTSYDVTYAGISDENGTPTLGLYSQATLTVVTNETTAVTGVSVDDVFANGVRVSWDPLPGATSYEVFYSLADDPYDDESSVVADSSTAATIGDLVSGNKYVFEVSAELIDDQGRLVVGDRSQPVFAMVQGHPAPTGFAITHPASGEMFFTYNPVSDADSYVIAASVLDPRGVDNPLVPDPVTVPAHASEEEKKISGLSNGVLYAFRIAAVIDGRVGEFTDDENSPRGVPQGVPAATDPTVVAVTSTSIEVTYPAPPVDEDRSQATSYEVTFAPASGEPVSVTSTEMSATAEGLAGGVTYTVSVRAGNDAGYGPPSPNPIQVTTADKPGVVQNLTAQRAEAGTSADLTWDEPAPDEGTSAPSAYRVDADPVTAGDPDPGEQIVATTSASFSGLAATGDYEFTVTAVTDAGDGPVARTGSIGVAPTPGPVVVDYDSGAARVTFPAPANSAYIPQARATQQATPGDAALMAAIRDGKADQLIDNQFALVEPDSLTCTDGTCVAVFDNFVDNVNGQAWVFQARFVDGELFASNWADADLTPVADAASATVVDYEDAHLTCPEGSQPYGEGCREYREYTYHDEQTGPAPIIDSFETDTGVCPDGYNMEDYGAQGKWCRLYGPAPTVSVKDPTPAGWSDDGSHWYRDVDPVFGAVNAATVNCPEGSEPYQDTCREYRDYTYHDEQTGPAPIIDSFETFTGVCPGGYNMEDYGAQGKWCRLYGPAPTQTVKDPTPAGWSDDGSRWYRDVSPLNVRDYFIRSAFAWAPDALAENGVVSMYVNGALTADGASAMLGRCPGTVTVQLWGLAGSTTTSYELCN